MPAAPIRRATSGGIEQASKRRSELIPILRIDQSAGLAVEDHLVGCASPRGQAGAAGAHRLQIDQAESFPSTRHCEQRRAVVEGGERGLGDESGKRHTVGQAQAGGLRFEPEPVVASARDHQSGGGRLRQCFKQGIVPLVAFAADHPPGDQGEAVANFFEQRSVDTPRRGAVFERERQDLGGEPRLQLACPGEGVAGIGETKLCAEERLSASRFKGSPDFDAMQEDRVGRAHRFRHERLHARRAEQVEYEGGAPRSELEGGDRCGEPGEAGFS